MNRSFYVLSVLLAERGMKGPVGHTEGPVEGYI